jgi:Fe-S cluster assembly protein SufB
MDAGMAAGRLSPLAGDEEPDWARVHYPKIDYQNAYYYAAPKKDGRLKQPGRSRSQAAGDLRQARHPAERADGGWPAYAVDAVFDSVSVATTFKEKLAEAGVIFCPMSEAVREHPELVRNIWARSCR